MKTHFGHIQFNVRPENMPFYKELFSFLGWQTLYDDHGMLGVGSGGRDSLWFNANGIKDAQNDYDAPGMNHIGIGAEARADVDAAAAYIAERGVPALFETPRHRPEFSSGDGQTYYQVMFETPDRILFEVVYTGPKVA